MTSVMAAPHTHTFARRELPSPPLTPYHNPFSRVQVEESSTARARAFVDDFLHKSPWRDQCDHIAVLWDEVPTMEELEAYGDLDKDEGTRACRRLFKAPVVWDDLGCGLWEKLRVAREQKKAALKGLGPMLRMGVVGDRRTSHPDEAAGPVRRGSDQSGVSVQSKSSTRSTSSRSEGRKALPKIFRTIMRRS
ncbi:hypothetical protein S40288_03698 [Stachybotrys chartarum IBT 40288]|nr:hypothetical protein S40288_03698 [Stachybotrys chartarum IBT 40288]